MRHAILQPAKHFLCDRGLSLLQNVIVSHLFVQKRQNAKIECIFFGGEGDMPVSCYLCSNNSHVLSALFNVCL